MTTQEDIDVAVEQMLVRAAEELKPSIPGFLPVRDERRVECDAKPPWEKLAPMPGAEPLWAEVTADLTIAEIAAIPIDKGTSLSALWPSIARHVTAWNVQAYDLEADGYRPVPPPAEMGPDAFRYAHKLVGEWLAFCLKFGHLGFANDALGKDRQPPNDTDDGLDASAPA